MKIKPFSLVRFRDSDEEPWSNPYVYITYIEGSAYPHVGLQAVSTEYWKKHHCFYSGKFKQVKEITK